MSIRLIARDLYRVLGEIKTLEKQLAEAPWDERPGLEEKLRQCKAEQTNLRRALDGAKNA